MNEVKTMVQIPLDLLESLIENNNLFLFQSRWMQGTTEKNAAEYASIEAVSVEAEKCKESQLQVMYHREFVPADGYEGLLKQARALQSITKTQQEQLAFARKLSGELYDQLTHVSNDRLNSELGANQMLEIPMHIDLPNDVSRCEGWIYDHEDAEKDIPCSVRNECARFTMNSGHGGRYIDAGGCHAKTTVFSPPVISGSGCVLKMEIHNG